MTLWPRLKSGDLVDVVAPGWACRKELLQPACEILASWGLRVRIPEGLVQPWTFFANTDEKRGSFLDQALRASDSQAVWCLRAASGTHRVLQPIFSKPKPKKVKLVIGFSDITSLHGALARKWNWPTLHGSMLDRLGEKNLDPAIVEKLRQVVFGEVNEVSYNNLEPLNDAAKKAKRVAGPIWGGNLTVIQSLIGTPFLPKTSGTILFFEDIGERGYRLDRSFVHLEQAGIFKGAKAIVLGTFTGGKEPSKPGEPVVNRRDWALENFAAAIKIPVFSGLPIGHGDLQWPLPLGVMAKLNLGDSNFSLSVAIDSGAKAKRLASGTAAPTRKVLHSGAAAEAALMARRAQSGRSVE